MFETAKAVTPRVTPPQPSRLSGQAPAGRPLVSRLVGRVEGIAAGVAGRPLRAWGWPGVVLCLLSVLLACGWPSGTAWALQPAASAVREVVLADLPVQAQRTYRLILAGGPFPYAKDGTVFANRERLLPIRPRGHYREYTVKTPGARDRGAKRVICDGVKATEPKACFYTEDHYASFRRIAP